MGVAAMVIGIVAAILAFIPFCGWMAFIPAIVGLVLGIVDVTLKSKSNKPKGQGIAGIVLNGVALAIFGLYTLFFAAGAMAASEEFRKGFNKADSQWKQKMEPMQKDPQNAPAQP